MNAPAEQTLDPGSRPLRVYLNVATSDVWSSAAVRALCHRLSEDGWNVPWYVVPNLKSADIWRLMLFHTRRTSDLVLICISSAALDNMVDAQKAIQSVLSVVEQQPEGTALLILLRLDETELPESLRHLQHIDLFQLDGCDQVLAVLRQQAAKLTEVMSPLRLTGRCLAEAGAVVEGEEDPRITAISGRLAELVPIPVAVAEGQASEDVVEHLVSTALKDRRADADCTVAILVYQETPDALAQLRMRQAQLRERVVVIPIPLAAIERSLVTPGAPAALLADYAERYLPGANLFDDRNAVADSLMFFGRGDLLEGLSADLGRGQSVGLFGLRKSGKTSVLLQLAYRLHAHPVVHLDLQRHGGSSRFGVELLEDILRQLTALLAQRAPHQAPDWLPLPHELQDGQAIGTFMGRFGVLVERLGRAGFRLPVVCLLDEMERLLPTPYDSREKADEFNVYFGALRSLAQQHRQLALLAADVHPDCNRVNRWPQASTGTNPLYSFFKETFLGPFAASETTEMLDGLSRLMGWGFDAETARAIHMSSGGHPFLARQLASLLRDRLAPGEDETVTGVAAARFLKRPLHYSGTLKDYFGQNVWADLETRGARASLAILRLLAEHVDDGVTDADLESALIGPSMREGEIVDALLWLEAVGLVTREAEGPLDRYRLRVPLLAQWIALQFGSIASTTRRAG